MEDERRLEIYTKTVSLYWNFANNQRLAYLVISREKPKKFRMNGEMTVGYLVGGFR